MWSNSGSNDGSAGLQATKLYLYEECAGQHKSEHYRWERAELPYGSPADLELREALVS